MGTKVIASYALPSPNDGNIREAGCFCVFRTPQNIHGILGKLNETCISAEKIGSRFAHVRMDFKTLLANGNIVVEQNDDPSFQLFPNIQITPCHDEDDDLAVHQDYCQVKDVSESKRAAAMMHKKWVRRNGMKSTGIQVDSSSIDLEWKKLGFDGNNKDAATAANTTTGKDEERDEETASCRRKLEDAERQLTYTKDKLQRSRLELSQRNNDYRKVKVLIFFIALVCFLFLLF